MKKILIFIKSNFIRIMASVCLIGLMFHWGAAGIMLALPVYLIWDC